jgi:predicted esterase
MNEERFSYALKQYQPNPGRFRNLKIFVSNGTNDKVSQVVDARSAVAALRRNGFVNVRFEQFGGSHEVYWAHVEEALRWFVE